MRSTKLFKLHHPRTTSLQGNSDTRGKNVLLVCIELNKKQKNKNKNLQSNIDSVLQKMKRRRKKTQYVINPLLFLTDSPEQTTSPNFFISAQSKKGMCYIFLLTITPPKISFWYRLGLVWQKKRKGSLNLSALERRSSGEVHIQI